MEKQLSTGTRTAPVPLALSRSAAPAVSTAQPGAIATLTRFYFQAYGKKVDAVQTLFRDQLDAPALGVPPSTPVPGGPARDTTELGGAPLDGAARMALQATVPGVEGGESGTGMANFSDTALLYAGVLEATCIRRIAAADRYPIHRAYPSPRGMFGADVELTEDGPTPLAVPALAITTHPDRFPAPYGTLRPSLALLESGHLLATLGLTLQQAGLQVETTIAPPAAGNQRAAQSARLDICARRTAGGGTLAPLGNAADRVIGAAAIARLAASASRGGAHDPRGGGPATLKDWLDRRSSGSSRHNLVTSGPIGEDISQFLRDLFSESLAQIAHLVPREGALRLFHLSLENNDLARKRVIEVFGDRPAAVRESSGFAAPFSSGSGFVWSIDFAAWVRRYGTDADVVVHTLLGWLCQWGCLGAAAAGHTARPARNFDEADWAAALHLPLAQTPAYQLWVRQPGLDETHSYLWTMLGSSQ